MAAEPLGSGAEETQMDSLLDHFRFRYPLRKDGDATGRADQVQVGLAIAAGALVTAGGQLEGGQPERVPAVDAHLQARPRGGRPRAVGGRRIAAGWEGWQLVAEEWSVVPIRAVE